MQRPHPDKRRQITQAAARLFAARPFHEVTLDDVAAAARVGKGTLYVYFKSKEELYGGLIDDGFGAMVTELRRRLDDRPGPALADVGIIVRSLLEHARRYPHLFHLMRAGRQLPCADRLAQHRQALMDLVGDVVRRGVRRRELRDANPGLTAAYVPSLVRAAVLYGPRGSTDDAIVAHILALLATGLGRPATPRPKPKPKPEPEQRRPRSR